MGHVGVSQLCYMLLTLFYFCLLSFFSGQRGFLSLAPIHPIPTWRYCERDGVKAILLYRGMRCERNQYRGVCVWASVCACK